jgi:glycolate oxidase FAD binding subunit
MTRDTALAHLVAQVQAARADQRPLCIRGGGTKDFYGEPPLGDKLDTRTLNGVSSYEPSELVITARAGTPLRDIEALLATKQQYLAFEPPRFGAASTIGGVVAAGLSGPSRSALGPVRDFVLGATMVNGRGEVLSFGGQVMKNVAGYDVSRVLAGSLGILGVIAEVSLKVLPVPRASATLRLDAEQADALLIIHRISASPMPLNASAWCNGTLMLRLSGAQAAVVSALKTIATSEGGEVLDPAVADAFWRGLRDQRDAYFVAAGEAIAQGATLWRLAVPATTPPLTLDGPTLLEWGGGLRWLVSRAPHAAVRRAMDAAGGHATVYFTQERSAGVFTPLSDPLARIHRNLKRAFDPDRVLNPGRLYPDL